MINTTSSEDRALNNLADFHLIADEIVGLVERFDNEIQEKDKRIEELEYIIEGLEERIEELENL